MSALANASSRLHVQRFGAGPPLVMLHGWAMHGGIWEDYARRLAQSFSIHLVDLPGHGYSVGFDEVAGIDEFAAAISERLAHFIDEPFYLVGWSLGGLIALHWSLQDPERIAGLQLIAANPCFVQRDDWPCGVNAPVLETFAAQLGEHYEQTLQRFVALQLGGDSGAREQLRALRRRLFERGAPSAGSLNAGLDILLHTDLRARLGQLVPAVQLVLGRRDTLVPCALADAIGAYAPGIDVRCLEGAGHAPFLSHPRQLLDYTQRFFA